MITMERILVVEDEKLIRMTLRDRLQKVGYRVLEAGTGAAALELLDDTDLVLLDLKLPDASGIDVLRQIRERNLDLAVILMTAYSSIDSAVEAMKLGAFDYLNKPVNHDDLLARIRKALETTDLRREVRRHRGEQERLYGVANIVGRSRPMQNVLVLVRKVAESAASTVLIQGDSGTGKDLVAKAIHYSSDRRDKPFMNITCSALAETLLESELFGHEKGSFTDARQAKKGLLELAEGGTVFLDEIGDMGLQLQAKLLRFLEEKTFKRVGGVRDIRVDVRVIAATNRDLERAVRESQFREDLYYRLKVIPIFLPALHERKEDIPDLVRHFVDQFNREFKKNTECLTAEAMDCLVRYDWPGNVRELRNVIERTMILESRQELDVTDLPEEIVQGAAAEPAGAGAEDAETGGYSTPVGPPRGPRFVLPESGVSLREVERDLVRQALEHAHGNQSRAGRLLGISRDALRYKMKKFGMT
jgi:DNA-binding NtrC family response regulator